MSVGEIVIASPAPIVKRGRPKKQPTTPMELLQLALSNNAAIDVIERIAALQKQLVDREAETQFNEALSAAQAELPRVAPDLFNNQTDSKYPSYAALDRVVRPVYTKYGFSLSFDEGETTKPGHVRVLCYVARGGFTRTYHRDICADGKGAKGGDVMTLTHAEGAAGSYGMRYLLRMIFNIAIGEEDTDGNMPSYDKLTEKLAAIGAATAETLERVFKDAYKEAMAKKDMQAIKKLIAAKDVRKHDLVSEVTQ